MDKKMVFNRAFGALLLYLIILPPGVLGYLFSASLKLPPFRNLSDGLNVVLWVVLRIVIFCGGIFMLYKLVRPLSGNLIFSVKPGENLLFDGAGTAVERFTVKFVLGVAMSSILIGFGAFGLFIFLAKLLRMM